MIGAIAGDIIGSVYEFNNIKTKDFPLFTRGSTYTDDTIMTAAVAKALLQSRDNHADFRTLLIEEMQSFGRRYPNPMGGYGANFAKWLTSPNPSPYNSYGNSSAMRVSPCGYIAVSLAEALSLAKASAEVTHNHPEGIKGAQAVAGAIFLALNDKDKDEIASFIKKNFYDLDFTLDEIRPSYQFNGSCQGTVPQAIVAFLESTSFEDAIRNAVSLGGDSDTLAAITGSIAYAYYSDILRPRDASPDVRQIQAQVHSMLPEEIANLAGELEGESIRRKGAYERIGIVQSIPHKKRSDNSLLFGINPPPVFTKKDNNMELVRASAFWSLEDFCSSKSCSEIMKHYGICVLNYYKYPQVIDRIEASPGAVYTSTLEECLIYLTHICCMDYLSGEVTDMEYVKRDRIRSIRMRIADLLFSEE